MSFFLEKKKTEMNIPVKFDTCSDDVEKSLRLAEAEQATAFDFDFDFDFYHLH